MKGVYTLLGISDQHVEIRGETLLHWLFDFCESAKQCSQEELKLSQDAAAKHFH